MGAAGPPAAPHLTVVPPVAQPQVTASQLRDVMARFATGVTVLTVGGEYMHGMTANAFSSVSLTPPLVLACVVRTARIHDAILRGGHFGVSVLGAEQEGVGRYFADKKRPDGVAGFQSVDYFTGRHTGVPLLTGSLGWLECELAASYDGGDHSIFVGTVLDAGSRSGPALLFFDGSFQQGLPPARSA
ncbi:MAG: flavin reductase family protein [Labedaea sp.]